MLLGHSLVGPPQQLLLIDDSNSLDPIELTDLPNDAQDQSGLPVDYIDASYSHQFGLQLVLTNVHCIVTVLNNMYSAISFIRHLLPIY